MKFSKGLDRDRILKILSEVPDKKDRNIVLRKVLDKSYEDRVLSKKAWDRIFTSEYLDNYKEPETSEFTTKHIHKAKDFRGRPILYSDFKNYKSEHGWLLVNITGIGEKTTNFNNLEPAAIETVYEILEEEVQKHIDKN